VIGVGQQHDKLLAAQPGAIIDLANHFLRMQHDVAQHAVARRMAVGIVDALEMVGVATLAPDETLAGLMERADAALYAAKADGRNRMVSAPLPPPAAQVSEGSRRG
jgi:GGDEF domain-containing protein